MPCWIPPWPGVYFPTILTYQARPPDVIFGADQADFVTFNLHMCVQIECYKVIRRHLCDKETFVLCSSRLHDTNVFPGMCLCVCCMLIYWDWRLITGCVYTCAHLSACIYSLHTACGWLCFCVCVCASMTQRPFTVNPNILVYTRHWSHSRGFAAHPRPAASAFRCTEYMAHNRVLGKEGLNNTGIDAGQVSSTACLSGSHWTKAGSHTLSLPPLTLAGGSLSPTHG